MYNDGMKRITIVAPAELLQRLQTIAHEEDTSLAAVIREALEWRAKQGNTIPRFIGAGRSEEPPYDTGRQAGEITYTPRSWR
jgi:predicted transcriptional regulator